MYMVKRGRVSMVVGSNSDLPTLIVNNIFAIVFIHIILTCEPFPAEIIILF